MNLDAIHNAIRKRVQENIEQDLEVQVFYDNQHESNPPSDLTKFVVASIKPTTNIKQHVGVSSAYRQTGILILMIMTEGGKGDGEALALAAECINTFKSITVDGVTYRTPSPEVIGTNRNGWWQINVNCPFYAE